MAEKLLTVWALAPAKPPSGPYGDLGPLQAYTILYDSGTGFTVEDGAGKAQDWYADQVTGSDDLRHQSITLWGVHHATFHAAGWPGGGIPDLSFRTEPRVPPRHSLLVDRMPFASDQEGVRAYQRLLQTCAVDGSFVRITKHTPGSSSSRQTGQWLGFRFPLLPADVLAGPPSGAVLDRDRVLEAAGAGFASDVDLKELGSPAEFAAELREGDARRIPYVAGGFRWDRTAREGDFESFAVNAAAIAVLGGTEFVHYKFSPSQADRWGDVAVLRDGFWWALAQTHPNPPDPGLELRNALANLACFPKSPGGGSGVPILTLLAQPDVAERAQVRVLDLLELTAAAVEPTPDASLPSCAGGATPPYHYLHLRQLAGGAFEWRRWIAVECPDDPAKVSPVLLRVTRPPVAAGVESPLTVRLEGLTDAHLLAIWSAKVARDFRGRAERDGVAGRVTLIPDIVGTCRGKHETAGGRWVAELAGVETWAEVSDGSMPTVRIDHLAIFRTDDSAAPASGGRSDYLGSEPCREVAGPATLAASALDFKGLATQAASGATLRVTGDIVVSLSTSRLDFAPVAGGGWALATPHALTVEAASVNADTAGAVAIGGLDITLGKGPLPRFGLRIDPAGRGDHWLGEEGDEALRLPVDHVAIGGADMIDHDLSRQPLLWGGALMGAGVLVGRDRRLEIDGRRSVDFDLRPESGATRGSVGRVEVTSLDPSPMLVTQTSMECLADPNDTEQSVCTWASNDARWRVVRLQDHLAEIGIAMPPQGVADAWERTAATDGANPDQVVEGERVPARLTSTTIVRVEGDERDRNPIGPWNLRHLLGATDADLPGARMTAIARFEALYGLEASAPHLTGLRVAEVAGWRGGPREPIAAARREDTTSIHAHRAGDWHAAIDVWQRRLATLDVRDERDTGATPIIDGVGYVIRKPATKTPTLAKPHYVRPSALNTEADGEEFGDWWSEVADGAILGGVLAGFERAEVIRNLLRRPTGTGRIEGLQLSALGATTKVQAEFDNGLTLVSADVALGWPNEARFERKGRIAALHHLAKHVIVYRRAFVPSRQFAAEQDRHLGRPIMRKSEEYIEITQAVRSYPDRAGASPFEAGALKAARFRTVRIPVHGSWASALVDPRIEGYAIPLWREGADAGVYPRPDVELSLAAAQLDPPAAAEPIARRIETPQRLAFYTLTSIIGDGGASTPPGDVELWPLVYRQDFVDRPQDVPSARPIPKEAYGLGDATNPRPPVAIEAPGFEDHTLLLEAGAPVNVLEGRSAKAMVADLRSVLALRARARPAKTELTGAALRFSNMAAGSDHVAALANLVQAPGSSADGLRDAAVRELNALTGTLTWNTGQADPLKDLSFDGLCGWAHEPARRFGTLVEQLRNAPIGDEDWEAGRATVLRRLRQVQTTIDAVLPFDDTFKALFAPLVDKATATREDIGTRLRKEASTLGADLRGSVEAWLDVLDDAAAPVDSLARDLDDGTVEAAEALDRVRREIGDAMRTLAAGRERATAVLPRLADLVAEIGRAADRIAKPAPKAAALATAIAGRIDAVRADLARRLPDVEAQLQGPLARASELLAQWKADTLHTGKEAADVLRIAADLPGKVRTAALAQVSAAEALLKDVADQIDATLADEIRQAGDSIASLPGALGFDTPIRLASEQITRLLQLAAYAPTPTAILRDLRDQRTAILEIADPVQAELEEVAKTLCGYLQGADQIAAELLGDWNTRIKTLTDELIALGADYDAIRAKVEQVVHGVDIALGQLRTAVGEVLDGRFLDQLTSAEVKPQGLDQAVGLSLLRAAGAPPIVEQLVFNRDRIAYHFEERARVIITPVTALVDQADQALRGVGVTLPTLGIEDQLLAPAHALFDDLREKGGDILQDMKLKAKDVLKDFAGLKDMLPKLEFGSELAKAVRITHDYDAERKVVWLQAEIGYGPKTQDLFSHDAFAIVAEDMRLYGVSRFERGLSGGESRSVKASLTSNWRLVIGGMPLVLIRDAVVRYDQSQGLKFDIDPKKIEFPGAMQMLTELLSALNGGDQPLAIEMLLDEETGRPIGLRSRYDLPPTAFSAGAFAVFNAALGIHLDLAQRSEFEIRSFAYFGRRESPFALTVSFLGGGGYLEAEAVHRPSSRSTDLAVRVSIGAVAGTGFSFGPIRGSIQLYLGMEATFFSGSGGSRLAISAMIVLTGSVTVWGFVTVDLGVRLAITYDGSKMQGTGDIHVSVRISRFFKKSFSRAITYSL